MAFVALEFEDDQVYVAAAKTAGKRAEITHLFSVSLSGSDEEAAQALKSQLSKHGASRADAIVVVGRSDVEMREIVVPPAPTRELPDMVRFIARNEFATMNDNWAFDFVPLSDDESSSRKVIAAGISPERKTQVTSIAESAGLKIKHLVLRPYAAVDLVRERLSDGDCRLLIDQNGDKSDLTIVDGTRLLATRSVRVPASYEGEQRIDAIITEAKRTLASSRKILGDRTIDKITIFGHNETGESLKEKFEALGKDVALINPLHVNSVSNRIQEPQNPERYAALIGAIQNQQSNHPHLIDFVNPRKPIIEKRDMSKLYLYGGIALAAFLLASIFGWYTLRQDSADNAKLQAKLDELRTQNAGNENRPGVDKIFAEVGKIDKWVASDVNWLEEIYQYSDKALTPDDTIIDTFDASVSKREGERPKMTITSKLASVQIEKELLKSLGDRPFLVSTGRGAENDDETYPLTTNLSVSLVDRSDDWIGAVDEKAADFINARNERLAQEAAALQNTEQNTEQHTETEIAPAESTGGAAESNKAGTTSDE
jgi:Tfp pilus assembly PilM family ATPase